MEVVSTSLANVKIIKPRVFGDVRGYFMETFRDSWFRQNVANVSFVQDNQSFSKQGILRGLHYQTEQTQGKLVRVTKGTVFDVAVDMRALSKTRGQWVGVELSDKNHYQLWVPPGFAHGFYVMSEFAEFTYKCTDYYHPASEVCVKFDDAQLNITWPMQENIELLISDKDRDGLSFSDAPLL